MRIMIDEIKDLFDNDFFRDEERFDYLKMIGGGLLLLAVAIYFIAAFRSSPEVPNAELIVFMMVIMGIVAGSVANWYFLKLLMAAHYYRGRPHASSENREIRKLNRKLATLDDKQNEIKALLDQPSLKPDRKEALTDALQLILNQVAAIKGRIAVLTYIAWETVASHDIYTIYSSAAAARLKKPDTARTILEQIIEDGSRIACQLELSNHNVPVDEIVTRYETVISACRALADDMECRQITGILTDVRQVQDNSPLMLPESNFADSIKTLQDISARPLDRELLFEHLRVKSLSNLIEG